MRPSARTAVCGGSIRQTTFTIEADAFGRRRNRYAAAHITSDVVVGIPAIVSVGGAHATRIHGVAFSLALMARDAYLPRTLALGGYRRHDW